jgi:hypothetical protein
MPVVYAGGFSPWSGSHTLSATVYTDPQLGHVEWFLRHTVRTALVERLRLDLERSGLPSSGLCNPTVCTSRASPNTHTPIEVASSLQALGAAAWLRIVGASTTEAARWTALARAQDHPG